MVQPWAPTAGYGTFPKRILNPIVIRFGTPLTPGAGGPRTSRPTVTRLSPEDSTPH